MLQTDRSTSVRWDMLQNLTSLAAMEVDRKRFFSHCAKLLYRHFRYDRFCVNLYDNKEQLTAYAPAYGVAIESLDNHARTIKNTVAAMVIESRKPLFLKDISVRGIAERCPVLAGSGFNFSLAFPLILGNEIFGTLHISYFRWHDDMEQLFMLLTELSPALAICLFTVLERERRGALSSPESALSASRRPDMEGRLLETRDMAGVMHVAARVAGLDIPVLITGETGTGKSMLARWLHRRSPRRNAAFVKVNCPTLSSSLFESEMFGHVKGAFTGAGGSRMGRLEAADNGTLFLDEIGDLATDMQSKLLQVLEEGTFERVGETRPRHVDVRVISATNIDIPRAMKTGTLRRDLFYRLAPVILHLPPLRERRADIPGWATWFLSSLSRQWALQPPRLSVRVLKILSAHDWPGNLRELRNVIARILLHSLDGAVDETFVGSLLREGPGGEGYPAPDGDAARPMSGFPSLEEHERAHILEALRRTGGRLSGTLGAAALLGIPRSTLQHRMRKLGIGPSPKGIA
ncbi:sigma-54-dependent Fis family transcriptional regulator [uncultured Desulfovibrio sp.]|uniref:sigma-54 interaction domain-containing protein n=1 Tax=uncultured Desulfovibrio sp. TaxID=167968 RepID=UPI00320A2BF9